MALTGTDRGTGNHNTGAASFTLTPASNFAAGVAVLCVAADNSSSQGATNDFTTCTDTLGNRWRLIQAPIFDNGAASAGVQGAFFVTDQSAGLLTTGTTITVAFGSSPVAKTWTLTEITAAAGSYPVFRVGFDGNAGQSGTTAPSMGTSQNSEVGEMLIATIFMECGTTQTCTQDSDTTNGNWSAQQYNEIGSTTSGSAICTQRKLQTTTASNQTFNPTLGASADTVGAYAIFREVTPNRFALGGVG